MSSKPVHPSRFPAPLLLSSKKDTAQVAVVLQSDPKGKARTVTVAADAWKEAEKFVAGGDTREAVRYLWDAAAGFERMQAASDPKQATVQSSLDRFLDGIFSSIDSPEDKPLTQSVRMGGRDVSVCAESRLWTAYLQAPADQRVSALRNLMTSSLSIDGVRTPQIAASRMTHVTILFYPPADDRMIPKRIVFTIDQWKEAAEKVIRGDAAGANHFLDEIHKKTLRETYPETFGKSKFFAPAPPPNPVPAAPKLPEAPERDRVVLNRTERFQAMGFDFEDAALLAERTFEHPKGHVDVGEVERLMRLPDADAKRVFQLFS